MNIYLTKITRATSKTSVTPKIAFAAEWLRGSGFVPGASAQFLPEPCGCSFILCDESNHDESRHVVKIRLYRGVPQVVISGFHVSRAELTHGDMLLARYEPGLIRMRKLPVGSVKVVTAHLVGGWLADLGFTPSECFTVATEPDLITLRLCENARERVVELVKHARANKLNLLQVQKEQSGARKFYPVIDLPPKCLENAGFLPDDAFFAVYEHGLIKLQKLDFVGLGF